MPVSLGLLVVQAVAAGYPPQSSLDAFDLPNA
jgi:hypothetical protein